MVKLPAFRAAALAGAAVFVCVAAALAVGCGSDSRTPASRKLKAWCRVPTRTSAAGTRTLTCNLGSRGREALRKGSLKLTLRTTFAPSAGTAVSVNRVVSIPRRR